MPLSNKTVSNKTLIGGGVVQKGIPPTATNYWGLSGNGSRPLRIKANMGRTSQRNFERPWVFETLTNSIGPGGSFPQERRLQYAIDLYISSPTDAEEAFGPINTWDISRVTSLDSAFINATNFNSDISNWNTSNIESLKETFSGASSFNQNIGSWDVSKVTTLEATFKGASVFNAPLGRTQTQEGWNTKNVENMSGTFAAASAFNQNIGSWNVSLCINFNSMFFEAAAFDNSGDWGPQVAPLPQKTMVDWKPASLTPSPGKADYTSMFESALAFTGGEEAGGSNIRVWKVARGSFGYPPAAPGIYPVAPNFLLNSPPSGNTLLGPIGGVIVGPGASGLAELELDVGNVLIPQTGPLTDADTFFPNAI